MTAQSIDELAIEMAAEGCAETEAVVEPPSWRRNARMAAAQLGRNDLVIRARDGIVTACLKGWPRDAVERAVQTSALRRAAVSAWIQPLADAARQRATTARSRRSPAARAERRRTTTLRLVPDEKVDAPQRV